ncbi:MAG: hypothetical protein K0R57_2218 [Paenibacillaceae bacterium]|nr:hypothetical protein [Paenibacillaceae bacterium]
MIKAQTKYKPIERRILRGKLAALELFSTHAIRQEGLDPAVPAPMTPQRLIFVPDVQQPEGVKELSKETVQKIRSWLIVFMVLQLSISGLIPQILSEPRAYASGEPAETLSVMLAPKDDAYVNGGASANNNYGSAATLITKYSAASADQRRESYLKFDLRQISGLVNSVTLYVYGAVTDGGGTAIDVNLHEVNEDAWSETTLTWNNKPAVGSILGTVNFNKTVQWRPFDITAFAQQEFAGDRVISLALAESAAAGLLVNLNSKENTANAPYVLVNYTPIHDVAPPVWPAGSVLQAEDLTSNSAKLSWPAASDEQAVVNYRIYQDGTLAATVTGRTYQYQATGLASATGYVYKVEAEDPAGNISSDGPQVNMHTLEAEYNYIWLEGEAAAQVSGDYKVRTDVNASSQKTLTLDSTDTAKTHKADYSFAVPKTGAYAVWALSSSGSEAYVSRYKWRLDTGTYQNAAPLTRIAGGYTTSDSRKVPMYWDKLSETTLTEGSHSFTILTDAMRELTSRFYYHAWDALVIAPVDWNWTPDKLNKPFDPQKISVDYAGGSLSTAQANPEEQITVSVKNRLIEPFQGNLSLYAELVWKGQTVVRVIQEPAVPMRDWQVNQDYTDQMVLTVPYTAVASQYEIRTGIAGVNYANTGSSARVGDLTIGQPESATPPITAHIQELVLPASVSEDQAGEGAVTLALNRAADFELSGYLSYWQDDILWGIAEIPSLPPGWNGPQTTVMSIPVTVPKGLPAGQYTVRFGLHHVGIEQAAETRITVTDSGETGATGAYKPLSHGIYADQATGQSHTWYVNQAHTMFWDGKPFIPVGGMWTSKYLINFDIANPAGNKANWEYDLAVLDQMKQNGVKDLYLNSVVTGTNLPAWAWQWIIEQLEARGFTYGLQFNGRANAANSNSGYLIRANEAGGSYKVENVTSSGEVALELATSAVQGFTSPLSTLFLVVNAATGEAVQSGTGTVDSVESGKYKVRANVVIPEVGSYTVYFTPRIKFNGNAMKNIWDGAAATEQALGGLIGKLETGPGFRLFVDPIVNESGIVNWYESLVMDSPVFRQQYRSWLEHKYGTVEQLNEAWQMQAPLPSLDVAARLVPLHNGPDGTPGADQVYLMDPAAEQRYAGNIRTGVLWDDYLAFRDDSFGEFNNRIADRLKQSADAPVIYKHIGLMKRYNVNRQLRGGFDGLGGEIYGEEALTLTRKSGDVYATVEQAAKTAWYLVTETQLDETVSRKAASGEIGYPDEAAMHEHFDVLIAAGAKGLYDFLFHAPHDANIKNYYSYTAKPEEYGWLEHYRNQLLSEESLAVMTDARPQAFQAYLYPAGQMWWYKPTQRTAVLPGTDYQGAGSLQASNGNWVLPTADWQVATDTMLVSLEDDPATTVWGEPIRSTPNLRDSGRNIIYMGLRNNLGALPNLDAYFTSETATLETGDTVQVLKPTPTSQVLQATPDGKVWALRDGSLWIISHSNWMDKFGSDYMFVNFLGDLDLSPPMAPVAQAFTATGLEDTMLPFQAADFKLDSAYGAALASVLITALPSNGRLLLDGAEVTASQEIYADDLNRLSFAPDADWNGTAVFRWMGSDGWAYSSAAAEASIVVQPVNDKPVSYGGSYSMLMNQELSGALTAADSDSAQLTYTIVAQGSKGTVTLAENVADGSGGSFETAFVYTPRQGEQGVDSFAFSVSDGEEDSLVSTVEIVINPGQSTYVPIPASPVSSAPSSSPNPKPGPIEVAIDGVKQDQLATVEMVMSGDRTVMVVALDHDKVMEQLEKNHSGKLTISLATEADVVVGGINLQLIKEMEKKAAVLDIRTQRAAYTLPAAQIRADELLEQFGEQASLQDIRISVRIAEASREDTQLLQREADKGGYTIVAKPVEFRVVAEFGGKEMGISRFSSFVERSISIPEDTDSSPITTGVVLGGDGGITPVPTRLVKEGDRTFAVMNSLTNSTYALIGSKTAFSDVENHWSREVVNDLASRLVLQGVNEREFAPDRAVTRGEFAAIIVRSLGLATESGAARAAFKDINGGEWYAGAVGAAAAYGLINGYEDGGFGADHGITREEAMVILNRALVYTKLHGASFPSGTAAFVDGHEVSSWAEDSVARLIHYRLVEGNKGFLHPNDPITRAETAAIIRRMLQQAELISSS